MFWKKKPAVSTEAKPQKAPKPAGKKLSPKDILASQIEQLGPGQSIRHQLPEFYGGDLVIIEPNPNYPSKGRKYTMNIQKMVNGKPVGEANLFWESNKPRDIAAWIVDRNGALVS